MSEYEKIDGKAVAAKVLQETEAAIAALKAIWDGRLGLLWWWLGTIPRRTRM